MGKILSNDFNDKINKVNNLIDSAKITTIEKNTTINTKENIKADTINALQNAINKLEESFSNNCCQSVNTNCCQTCQSSKCQSQCYVPDCDCDSH